MNLKTYQQKAVDKLLDRLKGLTLTGQSRRIIFQAPTGSGKTIMMAELLNRIVTEPSLSQESFSFIWAAPRKLHHQSKVKLEKYFESTQFLSCSEFFELSQNRIDSNQILFLNWESINKKDSNTIIKENEREFYLQKVVENTIESSRKIILIIDESHHHANSEISQQLIEVMSPHVTFAVSATPTLENPDEIVKITLDEVREEGMIKKSVSLNEGFTNVLEKDSVKSQLSEGQDSFVLKQAIAKRNELLTAYKQQGSNVNPLVLIQLPDKKANEDEILRLEIVEILKKEYGITVENGKLAIYLSEEKENLENIAKNENETQILIFKQAIALGWDCPRAQVLVLFREHKSVNFSIQTVGRILRMPEPDSGHYGVESLNKGYVYTNLADIAINEELARGYITIYTSRRIVDYRDINLNSVYRLRQRERTRLNSEFVGVFLRAALDYDLKSKLKMENQKVERGLIADAEIFDVDSNKNSTFVGKLQVNVDNELDLQKIFDSFIRKNLEPFHPEDRSVGRLKEAIYGFFATSFVLEYASDQVEIINIALSKSNAGHFTNVIDAAKATYIELVSTREKELVTVTGWNVPETLNFTGEESSYEMVLSAMLPFYSSSKFKTELAFISYLESSQRVKWWFKNGERDSTYFAIPYVENDQPKPFYVDFIVQLKDGRIGLLDTKRGQTVKTSKEKVDGLRKYLSKNLTTFGGIVDNTKVDFSGRWMFFEGDSTELKEGDFSNWTLLEL
jgi:type III restriction enzyme